MNCLVIVTYLTVIGILNSRERSLFATAQDDEAGEFNGCFNMSAYKKAHDKTVTNRRLMRERIGAKCETAQNADNCIKDEIMRNITPALFKKQVNTYLLDLSVKSTLASIIDSCFANKREFYPCYLRGLKRNCPELAGFIDTILESAPYYFPEN